MRSLGRLPTALSLVIEVSNPATSRRPRAWHWQVERSSASVLARAKMIPFIGECRKVLKDESTTKRICVALSCLLVLLAMAGATGWLNSVASAQEPAPGGD